MRRESFFITAPPAILRKARDCRRVPDHLIFSLDLDTAVIAVRSSRNWMVFRIWMIFVQDLDWFFLALVFRTDLDLGFSGSGFSDSS
jgi:hypothetical protein